MFPWRKTIFFILIFLIGALGGMAGERILFPYLAGKPLFERIRFIREAAHGTIIINKTEELIIKENDFLKESIKRLSVSVVGVRALDKKNKPVTEGTGFIITADGLIITANHLLPSGRNYEVLLDGSSFAASLKIRDSASGMGLLKIEKSNLPVVSIANFEDLNLGEIVFLLGADSEENKLIKFVNTGIIKAIKDDVLETNIIESNQLANGSPLLNMEGKVVGLNLIDTHGNLSTVSAKKIRDLLNIALQ